MLRHGADHSAANMRGRGDRSHKHSLGHPGESEETVLPLTGHSRELAGSDLVRLLLDLPQNRPRTSRECRETALYDEGMVEIVIPPNLLVNRNLQSSIRVWRTAGAGSATNFRWRQWLAGETKNLSNRLGPHDGVLWPM